MMSQRFATRLLRSIAVLGSTIFVTMRRLPTSTVVVWLFFLVVDAVAVRRIRPWTVLGRARISTLDTTKTTRRLLQYRGGSDSEGASSSDDVNAQDSDNEAGSDESDDESGLESLLFNKETTSTLLRVGKKTCLLVGRLAMKTISAASRAVVAAFHSEDAPEEDDENAEPVPIYTSVMRVLTRMAKAAFYPESLTTTGDATTPSASTRAKSLDDAVDDNQDSMRTLSAKKSRSAAPFSTQDEETSKPILRLPDFGTYLSKSYNVEATRDDLDQIDKGMPVLGGTISDALRIARSKARLLVVMIPSSKPSGKPAAADVEAIKSLLSAEVATVAERKARKSGQTSSYIIWGAKAGSAEGVTALKRIKATQTNSKGQKRPILSVVYPAQVMGSDGLPKIVPRLLAQHHCSPPPSSEMMAAWLNALRKRHAKQYATMQLELKEMELHRERTKGYKGSVQSDRERQERERREAEEERRKEAADKMRREAVLQRREELKTSMPVEPAEDDPEAKTIALRLADGRTSQRRFAGDTKLATLFNWVDVEFEMERENIVLTTLNGQKSFEWDNNNDVILSEAGFGRMVGLRVTEKKTSNASSS